MQLPAFFGHKKSINLLPRDAFEMSPLGVILEWALVFGKWTVILTQLIVMGAFLWRFALDRELTDLRKSIATDIAVVKSYEQIERDYVLAQKQIAQAKTAIAQQQLLLHTLLEIEFITPPEVWYDKMTLTPNELTMTAYASSLSSFGQFLTSIQTDARFSSVRLGKVESSTTRGAQMQFDIALSLASPVPGGKK